ncbi:hypothetical protein GQ55_2G026500 [Panicum hallii var. hallii]|uniref:Uncharacterized protein n=1 Tax=Panicum hallii var. hallii TaxID=1504633 RepID=A0A2T7EKR2_9POAL|nr:hypothetical protein GQ55_2G026500 [Panicum hallii var. hallii]
MFWMESWNYDVPREDDGSCRHSISFESLFSAAADEPPSSTAFRHAAFISAARSLALLPSSPPPISARTARSSSAASTKLPLLLSTPIATAAPAAATSANAFRCCSAYSGHGAIGTPHQRLSRIEFHPQCVTKPPTAARARISFCGAAVGHTRPLPLVRSRKPSGRSSARLASVGCRDPGAGGPRSTQRNRCPLRSRPRATSCACAAVKNPPLPKQRNTTDAGGCASSHRTQSCGGSAGGGNEITGPMG